MKDQVSWAEGEGDRPGGGGCRDAACYRLLYCCSIVFCCVICCQTGGTKWLDQYDGRLGGDVG